MSGLFGRWSQDRPREPASDTDRERGPGVLSHLPRSFPETDKAMAPAPCVEAAGQLRPSTGRRRGAGKLATSAWDGGIWQGRRGRDWSLGHLNPLLVAGSAAYVTVSCVLEAEMPALPKVVCHSGLLKNIFCY